MWGELSMYLSMACFMFVAGFVYQSIEVLPGIAESVHPLCAAVAEGQLVLVEERKGLLHRPDGGVDVDLRLTHLEHSKEGNTHARTHTRV